MPRISSRMRQVILYTTLVAIVLTTLFPLYWMFLTSIRTKKQNMGQPKFLPEGLYLKNYMETFIQGPFLRYLFNSVIIATFNTLLVLALAIPATYAFSRLDLYGSKHLFFWLITNRMAPPAAFILPFIFLASRLNLLDTHLVLILVYCIFNLPFAIWLLKGMVDKIPKSLDEAALVDGCTIGGVIGRIIIPVAKSGIAATALLSWLFAWNHYLFAVVLTNVKARTITTGLATFVTEIGIDWGNMAAVSVVSAIPAFLFLFLVQRHIVAGLTFGAVK